MSPCGKRHDSDVSSASHALAASMRSPDLGATFLCNIAGAGELARKCDGRDDA